MDGDKQNDMDDLIPDREVELSTGETVTVQPLHWVQLPKGSMHIERVISAAMQSGVLDEYGSLNLAGLMGLIAAAGGHINELILLCTYKDGERVSRDWLGTVSIDDGLDLTRAVILANWRESVAKKLESLSLEVTALLAGVASSNVSSSMDTDGQISSSTRSARSSVS